MQFKNLVIKKSSSLHRHLFLTYLFFLISSCSESNYTNTIPITIAKSDFIVRIPYTGKLEAVKSTSINMPPTVRRPQVIKWLAQENTNVKKGQVVAIFDGRKFQYQSEQEQFEIDKANISLVVKKHKLDNEKTEIDSDKLLINSELTIANRYNIDDLTVYSRIEIIDALKNTDYLMAKQDYTFWRSDSHEVKSISELQLLSLQKGQHDTKLANYQDALKQMEIIAPHDGLFVLNENWSGEKPHQGDTVFPGMQLAKLPDLSKLQAKIYILESEAAGAKVDQKVVLKLDAYPTEKIKGILSKIDPIAKTRSRNSPVKYFEAIVSLNGSPKSHWKPGSQLSGSIYVAKKQSVINIPTQAIYKKDNLYYVDTISGNDFIPTTIKLGIRSNSKTEIVDGLSSGDVIALFNPNIQNN